MPLFLAISLGGCGSSNSYEQLLYENAKSDPTAQYDYAIYQLTINEQFELGKAYLMKAIENQNLMAVSYWGQNSKWIDTAIRAKNGSAADQRILGISYSNPANPVSSTPISEKSIKWLSMSASNGDQLAAAYLAGLYSRGGILPVDQKKATSWYLRAAELNHADSMYLLALRYGRGIGAEIDHSAAQYWLTVAAYSAQPNALSSITSDYAQGNNVRQNDAWAVFWGARLESNTAQLVANALVNLPRLQPLHNKTELYPSFSIKINSNLPSETVDSKTDLYALHYEGDWVEVFNPLSNRVSYIPQAKTKQIFKGKKSSLKDGDYHLCEIECSFNECVKNNLDGTSSSFRYDVNKVKICQIVNM